MEAVQVAISCLKEVSPSSIAVAVAIIFATTAVYRSFFSPISAIPGPFLNSFTNIPLLYHVLTGKYDTYTRALHARYGEIVRIGYNKVSLSSTADTRLVLATHAFLKAPSYETGTLRSPTTFSTTSPELNKTRRRQLGNGFAMHTIKAMEDLVLENGVLSLISSWDKKLADKDSVLVNYFYGFHFLGLDVIGAVGFGQSFNAIANDKTDIAEHVLGSLNLTSLRSSMPIIKPIQSWIVPNLIRSVKVVENVVDNSITNRRKLVKDTGKITQADILQKFIDAHDPITGETLDEESLKSEIRLLLIAGTDTTSNTLSWTLMYLMHYPNVYKRLQDEIRAKFPDIAVPIRYSEAKSGLPYLTAVIYESMRMNPSVAGLLPRAVPKEGVALQGYHIPSSVELCVSFSACHRNEKTWPHPNRFDPERFMGPDSEERQKDVLAFSTGVRICIGRNLAWVELYTTLANLLRKYDFELPENAPYGPHFTHTEPKYEGTPVDIPGAAFTTSGPKNPRADCWVRISPASH